MSAEAWTPFRPFKDDRERLGAMRCGRRKCNRPSEFVSDCEDIGGRVALCGACMLEMTLGPLEQPARSPK